MEDSSPPDPQQEQADHYAALVKPGDAVETPDGQLWAVEKVADRDFFVTSAFTDSAGQICVDIYEPITTTIPKQLAHKVADARQVRRP